MLGEFNDVNINGSFKVNESVASPQKVIAAAIQLLCIERGWDFSGSIQIDETEYIDTKKPMVKVNSRLLDGDRSSSMFDGAS